MSLSIRNQAKLVGIAIAAAAILALGTSAYAADVKLKGGKNAKPTFVDNGLTLSATLSLTGLGMENIVIVLDATADPVATCTNPSGKQQPPGQNPAEVDVTGAVSLNQDEIDNGNLTATVMTQPPPRFVQPPEDCPGAGWTEEITDLMFTSATIFVYQPADNLVLTVACTFSQPTTGGTVPSNQVSCTQTQS